MRYAKWTLFTFILILAASAVWAQCATCPQPAQVQCPAPCPVQQVQCPEPCPVQQPCPQACPACPCPASVPAAMGAGPAADLQGLACPEFDPAYASRMYTQNNTIIAVTAFGAQRATDNNLRDISREINGYYTSANAKLQGWYSAATCEPLSADCGVAQPIIDQLSSQPCECFDAVYARTLSELVRQSNAANSIAATQATTPQMRQQAQFLSEKESDWTMRLDRWVNDHGAG